MLEHYRLLDLTLLMIENEEMIEKVTQETRSCALMKRTKLKMQAILYLAYVRFRPSSHMQG